MLTTPVFPSFQAMLAALGRRTGAAVHTLSQLTLCKLEDHLTPALDPRRLAKPAEGNHSRRRTFDLRLTFWSWVWQILQGNTSCREVVRQVQALFGLHDKPLPASATGAYCTARSKLPLPMLELAFADSVASAQKKAPPGKLLQGRPIRATDGSSVRLQDSKANRKDFPPSSSLPPNTGFPILQLGVLFCLASGAIIARVTGSTVLNELRLFLEGLLGKLQPNDIAIGDRKYGCYVVLAMIQRRGCDLVARVAERSRHIDFRQASKHLAHHDGLFIWRKPANVSPLVAPAEWAALPAEITVRILRRQITRRGFRTKMVTLVTTLLDPQLYPADDLFAAYLRRWRLEMCLDDIKTTLGMEQLSCLTPAMVQKELLMFLIAHNFLRWIMAQAAQQGAVDFEQISFKGTMDAFRQWTQAIAQAKGPGRKKKRRRLWLEMLEAIASDPLPRRPGRQEPRAVKKRPKYPPLNKPRHQYVDRWSRNKRRRVQRAKKRAALI